jgi:hypothetical protein
VVRVLAGLIGDAQGGDYGEAAQSWMAQLALWQTLQAEPDLLDSSAVLQAFDSLAQGSRFAWITTLENALAAGDYDLAQLMLVAPPQAQGVVVGSSDGSALLMDTDAGDAVFANYAAFYGLYLHYAAGSLSAEDSAQLDDLAHR